MAHYCAYQERSILETSTKLSDLGCNQEETELMLSWLQQEGFQDEERFTRSYIQSKLRANGWGKYKIRHALKRKGVSDMVVENGFNCVKEDEYRKIIVDLAIGRSRSIQEQDPLLIKNKVYHYLIRKGFESELVLTVLHELFPG